jgi:hypothetical protein
MFVTGQLRQSMKKAAVKLPPKLIHMQSKLLVE